MSKPMSPDELNELLRHISLEHGPFRRPAIGKQVKYVHPNIDMRSNCVFSITLRGYSWEEHFYTQNECRDLPESLFERCMKFLDEPQTLVSNG